MYRSNIWQSAPAFAAVALLWIVSRPLMASGSDQIIRGEADALPPGAIARFGTLRWSTAGSADVVAFNPDGQTIACGPYAGSFAHAIQLWDVPTGEMRRVFRGHTDLITGVRFSRDGKRLFSSCCDQTIRSWDVASGRRLQTFAFKDAVFAFDITADEKTMAVALRNEVYLWDVERRKRIVRLASDKFEVRDVRFSHDDRLLAAPTPFGSVTVWNVATQEPKFSLDGGRSYFCNIAFSTTGDHLAAGSGSGGEGRVWDLSEDERTLVMGREVWKRPRGEAVAFSPTDQLLAMNHGWTGIGLFDSLTGELKHELVGHTGHVGGLDFSPDGKVLASSAQDGTIRLWDVATGKQLHDRPGHQHSVEAVEFSPDGEFLITGGADHSVRIWNTRDRAQIGTVDSHQGTIRGIAISANGELVASIDDCYGVQPAMLRVWDVESGSSRLQLMGGDNRFAGVTFSPDGTSLIAGTEDNFVRIWDVSSGELIRSIRTGDNFEDFICSIAVSPNGELLACGVDNDSIHLYDANTSKLLHVLEGHDRHSDWLLFLPDGQRLASASADHTAITWDLRTGKAEHILRGHDHWVTSIVCLADGKTLATASGDATIRLWDLPTGRALRVIHAHRGEINALSASKCGRYLASASTDTTVLLWDAQQLIRDRDKQDD